MTLRWSVANRLKRSGIGDRLVRRNPLYYGRFLAHFRRLEAASPEERVEWTRARLEVVLRAARQTSYGRSYDGPLETWPMLDTERVRQCARTLVRGRALVASPAKTAGTTGTPVSLWRSPSSLVAEQAAIDRLLIAKGVDPIRHRTAILRGDDVAGGIRSGERWRLDNGGRRLVLSSNGLGPETIAAYADRITEFAPDVLQVYPSSLESLCLHLSAADISLEVPLTVCSSEILTPAAWSLAVATLSTTVLDYYGQAERSSFAYAFESRSYRFLPGYSYNELIPVPDESGARRYEVVSTGLWNLAMPLVRYRTGDLVEVDDEGDLEAIRWGLAPFQGIVGRTSHHLVAPDGSWLVGMDHIPRGVAHVVRTQIVQQGSDVRICVVADPGFCDGDRRKLLENAARKLPESMSAEVVTVTELRRAASGKTPFVIRDR